MAPKRSCDSKSLDEKEMLMCAEALLELSASFPNKKQRKMVAPVKGNPRKGPGVTGRELARQPEKKTGNSNNIKWGLGLPTLSSVDSLRNESKVGNFLEVCSLCKKKLHDKDIFMYGNYGAFCSTQCRNIKIISDGYNVEFFRQSENSSTAKKK